MIAGLKPYPATKDSGVAWLGEVPEHWEVRQLGQIGKFFKGNGGSKQDEVTEGLPCIRYGDLYTTHDFFIRRSRAFLSPADAGRYSPIRFGDVLFAASGETLEEIGKSAVNLIGGEAFCGGDLILFRAQAAMDSVFLGYATDCRPAAAQKAGMGRGITVKHIYTDELKRLTIAVPPLSEQLRIGHFIDRACRRIRRSIHAKQKLIKLLEEYSRGAVRRTTTRGLNPRARLRPSGLPWLGEVPEHWEVRRNGQLFSQRDQRNCPDLPILEVSLRTGVRVRAFGSDRRKQVMQDRSQYKRAAPGDLVYNMMRMWQGAVGVSPVEGLVSPAYVVAKPLTGTVADFYALHFRTSSYKIEIDRFSRGIVRDRNRLYWEDFKRMRSCYPPPQEQVAITSHLTSLGDSADVLFRKLSRQITLLRELRTRLIADVVTGKLDVREVAARLPVEQAVEQAVEPEEELEDELVEVGEEPDESEELDDEELADEEDAA